MDACFEDLRRENGEAPESYFLEISPVMQPGSTVMTLAVGEENQVFPTLAFANGIGEGL
jgi:hypothetical protein